MPETITSIGKEAFLNCTALSECMMPASLKEIGESAFQNTGLTALVLPGCTLGDSAFFCCSSLKTVEIGEGTENIPGQCFRKCTALESVMLPDSVQKIECGSYSDQGAFADCLNLKTVSFGTGISTINTSSFRASGDAMEAEFREGVTTIPDHAFDKCDISKLVLPKTVSALSDQAVSNCEALDCICIQAPDCEIADLESTIPADALICGYAESSAKEFADTYGRRFTVLRTDSEIICDLNGDGKTTLVDAELLIRFIAEDADVLAELKIDSPEMLDVNQDGLVTLKDVRMLLKSLKTE